MKTTVFIERAKFDSLQKNTHFLLKCIDVHYVIIFLGKKGKFFRTFSRLVLFILRATLLRFVPCIKHNCLSYMFHHICFIFAAYSKTIQAVHR